MLAEINMSLSKNTGAHQFSKSGFTITKMPDRLYPMSNIQKENRDPKAIAEVGVAVEPENLKRGYLVDINA